MQKKPNILLITTDQMRWDCLGCMGNPLIQTPNLDALAARGVLFRNAFTPDPICVPARASIMTGNYPHICTGIKDNHGKIREDQPLLTEVLKRVGCRTYAMGKLHFLPYSPPDQPRLVHGFEHVDLHESGRIVGQFDPRGESEGIEDYFDFLKSAGWFGYSRAHGVGNNDVRPCPSPLPAEYHVDHWIADCTICQIDRHRREFPDQPFFMWMSSPKPHSPYDPPRPYDAMYDPRQLPQPFGSPEMLFIRDPEIERTRQTHAVTSISPQAWQVIRSYYYACISFIDAMIGRVMAHLKQTDELDNTLVIFTADHGDLLGDFGACFKRNHLNGSVRIPFIAAGPGIARAKESNALVGLQDLLPTFAAFGGADIGQVVQGENLTRILAQPELAVRDWIYSTTEGPLGQSAMVTNSRWKYTYSEANATEEMYDQVNDPGEIRNLANDPEYQNLRGELRHMLRQCAVELEDTGLIDGDDFVHRTVDVEAFSNLPVNGMGWRWY
ncbi:sulfatase-like hydrolase/transferase [candidate division KSB1 bacterium]|nr:sulfatase-like hydrolase/transferase [candidate division KSB1 bacterium]